MDKLTPEFWLQLIVAVGMAIGVYAGIKGDLRVMHERIRNTNRRIDDMIPHHRRVGDSSDSEF